MIEFGWQYQCNRCRGKTRRQGNLLCVQCVTKRTWLTQWPALHGSMNPRPETQPSLTQDQLYGIQWTLAPRPRASSTGFNEPSLRDSGPALRCSMNPRPETQPSLIQGQLYGDSVNPRPETQPSLTQDQLYGVQWTLAPRPRASSTVFNEPSPRDLTQPHPGPTLRGSVNPRPKTSRLRGFYSCDYFLISVKLFVSSSPPEMNMK